MCTVTWIHEDDGYQLLCNRDEKRTRPPALAPALTQREGVRVISPVDGQRGGSWISVNEFGVSLCLLNGANLTGDGQAASSPDYRSRGLLLSDLSLANSAHNLCQRVTRVDLSVYAPFTLAVLEPGQPVSLIEWTGREIVMLPYGEPYMPLISSSFDTLTVRQTRLAEFRRRFRHGSKPDAARLYEFHESHGAAPSAYSPCMHRSDAETVSFSWVKVGGCHAEFFYSPGPPCAWQPGSSQILQLVQ